MQYLAIIVSLLAASVAAKSCKRGGSYCGSSLLRRGEFASRSPFRPSVRTRLVLAGAPKTDAPLSVAGNYRDHIVETLKAKGVSTDERHIQNSRFDCLSGGDIAYRQYCSHGCGGTNNEDPDYCL